MAVLPTMNKATIADVGELYYLLHLTTRTLMIMIAGPFFLGFTIEAFGE